LETLSVEFPPAHAISMMGSGGMPRYIHYLLHICSQRGSVDLKKITNCYDDWVKRAEKNIGAASTQFAMVASVRHFMRNVKDSKPVGVIPLAPAEVVKYVEQRRMNENANGPLKDLTRAVSVNYKHTVHPDAAHLDKVERLLDALRRAPGVTKKTRLHYIGAGKGRRKVVKDLIGSYFDDFVGYTVHKHDDDYQLWDQMTVPKYGPDDVVIDDPDGAGVSGYTDSLKKRVSLYKATPPRALIVVCHLGPDVSPKFMPYDLGDLATSYTSMAIGSPGKLHSPEMAFMFTEVGSSPDGGSQPMWLMAIVAKSIQMFIMNHCRRLMTDSGHITAITPKLVKTICGLNGEALLVDAHRVLQWSALPTKQFLMLTDLMPTAVGKIARDKADLQDALSGMDLDEVGASEKHKDDMED